MQHLLWHNLAMKQGDSKSPEGSVSVTEKPAPNTPTSTAPKPVAGEQPKPREIGGRDGPDPTRFGDWEKNGRCVDF